MHRPTWILKHMLNSTLLGVTWCNIVLWFIIIIIIIISIIILKKDKFNLRERASRTGYKVNTNSTRQETQLPQRNSASAAHMEGELGPPTQSLSAPSGYTYAYGRIRKPQRTYIKRAVH